MLWDTIYFNYIKHTTIIHVFSLKLYVHFSLHLWLIKVGTVRRLVADGLWLLIPFSCNYWSPYGSTWVRRESGDIIDLRILTTSSPDTKLRPKTKYPDTIVLIYGTKHGKAKRKNLGIRKFLVRYPEVYKGRSQ